MKTSYNTALSYIMLFLFLSITSYSYAHIYMWDRFERTALSPWQIQTSGSAFVDLRSENPQDTFSHQSHGVTSLNINDTNNSSYANARCQFPRLATSEIEYMVEFYFYVKTNNTQFSDLSIYKATDRTDQRANISIYLQGSFDSINRRYWRLKISDSLGYHYVPYKETLKYWYKFQIHQLASGRVNLWINGDSIGTYVSLSSTTRPDWITIGTLNGTQNGAAYWDDFIVTTPPRNAQHPRIYFNSSQIQELRNRRTNDNITPIGVSYKTLWDRRRSWVDEWKIGSITDRRYYLQYPYYQPPPLYLDTQVDWNAIGGRWQRRLELTAFVVKIDSNNSLFDTLRPCLKAITKWQLWVNPIDTIQFPPPSLIPFEYSNHSTAFITEGASIIYDLIFDRLSNYERMTMQNSILALGIGQMYLGLQKGLLTSSGWYWGNWGCLYSSSMGIACLALDDSITLPSFLNFVSNDFIPILISPTGPHPFFDPLGTNDEGLSYGTFSCQSLVRLAEAKKNVCGDLSLYQNPFIQQYINGFVHLLISGWENVVNFSDIETWAGLEVVMGDVFYILTSQYQSGLGQWLLSKMILYDESQAHDWGYGWPISYLPQFINLKADLQIIDPKDTLELSRHFAQIGWVSVRSNWLDTGLTVAFKCGPVTSGHGDHEDNNNFIIGRKNQWFITDRGYHLNDISYFHNVLTVDGQKQNWSASSRITAFENCGIDTQFIFFKGDASPSYSEIYNNYPLLKKWHRNGVLIRSPIPCVVLYDDIKSDTSRNLDWRLRPDQDSYHIGGGDSIYITGSDKNMFVKFLLPEAPRIEWDINQYPCDNIDYSLDSYFYSGDSVNSDSQPAKVYNVGPNANDTAVTEAKYLTVFYPCNSTVNRPTMTRIDASTMVGAQIKNNVVMFSKIDTTVDDVEFQVADDNIDTASILLVHLFPSTLYRIIAKDENNTVIYFDSSMSSNQGTLCFKVQMDGSISLRVSMNIRIADENATYPNQGKHLDRTINTQDCFLVYQDDNDNVIWQKRNDVVNDPVILDQGKYPAIAVTAGGSSWVCYSSEVENVQYLKCRINRSEEPYDWKELTICRAESIFAPSLVNAVVLEASPDENMGYVVYATKENDKSYIYFSAFDTLQEHKELYYTTVLDSCEGDISVLASSISVTPGDLIHIVWQKKEQNGAFSSIYYITTLEPIMAYDIRNSAIPNWSDIVQISREGHTEPASNPSVEAYGEYVYAAWRGPNEGGNPEFGDIWRRRRKVYALPEDWEEPENKSETREQESNYPVMSTDFVTVWQEQDEDNLNIWARFEPEQSAQPIFEIPTPSKYPHINGYWDPNPTVPPTFCVNTIWTEEFAPELYEVKFDCYHYEYNPNPEEKASLYYTVEIGDSSPSPYCTQRDGYVNNGQYKIDYGQQKLKYKLPYLHPSYYYDVRAIVYQQGQNNWTQKFDIDSAFSTTLAFEPNRPETVWIRIPQESYKNDTKVKHEIKKILGNRVVVADLRLYQKEEFISSGGSGSGPQSAGNTLIQRPVLYQSYPNPAKVRTVIRYSLPVSEKVSLQLYDISGRLVKTLVDEYQNAGNYSLTLNLKTLSAGIYFYRLKTDRFSQTKRTVLIR